MRSKAISLFLLLFLAGATISACGPQEETAPEGTDPAAPPTEEPIEEAPTAPEGEGGS